MNSLSISRVSKLESIRNLEQFKDWLVPSDTFKKSSTHKHDLACARFLVLLLCVALTGAIGFTLYRLIFSGQIEVVRTGYKVDIVEAPSLAICPFHTQSSIKIPDSSIENAVTVKKITKDGTETLVPGLVMCNYSRRCLCVELFNVSLRDTSQHDTPENIFCERVEVATTVTDPSSEQTLKIGMYDSIDRAPNWFFVNEGHFSMGQLELSKWLVTDMTISTIMYTLRGDWNALARQRHIFRYTSQEVGDRASSNTTTIIYEMKNFFIDETVSSEKSISVYTLGFLLFIIAARSVVVDAFYNTVMPEYVSPKEEPVERELTSPMRFLAGIFCSCCHYDSTDDGEKQPLNP